MGGGLSIAQADQNHYFNIHTLRAKNSDLMLVGVRCYTSYVKIYLATWINAGILWNLLFDKSRMLKNSFHKLQDQEDKTWCRYKNKIW